MNDEKQSGDAAMNKLLHVWKVETILPPRFNEQIWQRIELAETSSVRPLIRFRRWVAQTFARPAMAFSYVAILLLAGLTIGYWQGHQNSDRIAAELSARYVQLMSSYASPYQP